MIRECGSVINISQGADTFLKFEKKTVLRRMDKSGGLSNYQEASWRLILIRIKNFDWN